VPKHKKSFQFLRLEQAGFLGQELGAGVFVSPSSGIAVYTVSCKSSPSLICCSYCFVAFAALPPRRVCDSWGWMLPLSPTAVVEAAALPTAISTSFELCVAVLFGKLANRPLQV
jgi:hypothetical protein